ncbi:MAG: R3H domain-containing nucleic acid-binding protein [Synechococcales bacterium]|nr:R3H domain-containing nucleic acid-binding protein [Synechococcales bacterium]
MTSISNFPFKDSTPPDADTELPSTEDLEVVEYVAADDLARLLEILPQDLRQRLEGHPQREQLVEVVMDLGRLPEARFPDRAEYLSELPVSEADLNYCTDRVGSFSGDNRAGIEQTLHRISAMRNRAGEVVGLTCRVGRAVFGTVGMVRDLVGLGRSILLLGRPGVGKTTALREIARVLADDFNKRVVIIDTSNEIAGDGDVPHPAIGRARRMQVARPELQHQVMIEAVENHMPEVIVIDEIGTELEALAARTIAERGVQLVGTAHGNQIENLIKNPTLSDLVGGIQSVTLGDEEARRRGSQKSVLERKAPPTFDIAIEMLERYRWVVHDDVSETVDLLLRGRLPNPQIRTVKSSGKVAITRELGTVSGGKTTPLKSARSGYDSQGATGWRASGRMNPLPASDQFGRDRSSPNSYQLSQRQQFDELLNDSFDRPMASSMEEISSGDRDLFDIDPDGAPIHVYPYGVSRNTLEQVIHTLNLPVILTKDLENADGVLALRSHVKNHSKLRHMAKTRHLPIYTVKSNNTAQMIRALQRILKMDDAEAANAPINLSLFSRNGDEDELEALEEARLAVEQIVIPKGQPVELLPRSAKVRKMQHELVEHYRLKSTSFGEEPNRRLRIYPA